MARRSARQISAVVAVLALLATAAVLMARPAAADGSWDISWEVAHPAGLEPGEQGTVTFGGCEAIDPDGVSATTGVEQDGVTVLATVPAGIAVEGNVASFTVPEGASGVLFLTSRFNHETCPSEAVTVAFPLAQPFLTGHRPNASVFPEQFEPGDSPTYTFPACPLEGVYARIRLQSTQILAIDGPIWGVGTALDLPNYVPHERLVGRGPNPVPYEVEVQEDAIGLLVTVDCPRMPPEEGWSSAASAGWVSSSVLPTTTTISGEVEQPRPTASVEVEVGDGPATAVGTVDLFVDGAEEPFASAPYDPAEPWLVDLSALEPGERSLVAAYSGGEDEGGTYGPSSSDPLVVDLRQATSIEVTAAEAPAFGAGSLTAVLADGPAAGGTVAWWVDGVLVDETGFTGNPVQGSVGGLVPGAHEVVATYTGDGGYDASTSEPYAFSVPTGFVDVPEGSIFATPIAWMASEGIANGYPGDLFQPTAPTARQAMAAFLWRLEGSPPPPVDAPRFSDVPETNPFFEAISWAAAQGIVGGYPDGTFQPTASASRQAAVAMIWRLAGSPPPPVDAPRFSDVPETNPFFEAISWAAATGVAGGYGDGTFQPTAVATRQVVSAFIFNFHFAGDPH